MNILMNTPVNMTDWSQNFIGSCAVSFIGLGLAVLILLFWGIESERFNYQWALRIRAEAETERILTQIMASARELALQEKPPPADTSMEEAWREYSALYVRAFEIREEDELLAIEEEANSLIERIKQHFNFTGRPK